jgi:hypothetical protein
MARLPTDPRARPLLPRLRTKGKGINYFGSVPIFAVETCRLSVVRVAPASVGVQVSPKTDAGAVSGATAAPTMVIMNPAR